MARCTRARSDLDPLPQRYDGVRICPDSSHSTHNPTTTLLFDREPFLRPIATKEQRRTVLWGNDISVRDY